MVRLIDIAYGLSRIARYHGHTKGPLPWSVAQHSVLVESLLPEDADTVTRLHALLHDAHETYIGDMTTPVIAAIGTDLQAKVWSLKYVIDCAIWQVFGLIAPTSEQHGMIKLADRHALDFERHFLLGPAPREWDIPPISPYQGNQITMLEPLSPDDAKSAFRLRFLQLSADRHGLTDSGA